MRWVSLAIAATGLCAVLAVWLAPPPVPGVTEGNFDKVTGGMTLEEVSALLGSEGREVKTAREPELPVYGEVIWVWSNLEAWIWIGFSQGRVVSKRFFVNML